MTLISLSFNFNFTDASDEVNSRQDDHSVPLDETIRVQHVENIVDKKRFDRKKPRKPLVVKKVPQKHPKLPNLGISSKTRTSKKKNSSTVFKVSCSKRGSNSNKNSSAVSEFPKPAIKPGKRKRASSVSNLNYFCENLVPTKLIVHFFCRMKETAMVMLTLLVNAIPTLNLHLQSSSKLELKF